MLYGTIGAISVYRISRSIKQRNARTRSVVKRLQRYTMATSFCFSLCLIYSLANIIVRRQRQYYLDFPPCNITAHWLRGPTILRLTTYVIVYFLTGHTVHSRQMNVAKMPGMELSRAGTNVSDRVEKYSRPSSSKVTKCQDPERIPQSLPATTAVSMGVTPASLDDFNAPTSSSTVQQSLNPLNGWMPGKQV